MFFTSHGPRATGHDSPHFLADVLAGLRKPVKELPCQYFYDEAGSHLFDAICEQPEYYPTRTELAIMAAHAPEMGALLGPGCQVVEFGSGTSLKTRHLLEHLPRPAGYVPVDVAAGHLAAAARGLAARFPEVEVRPLVADFTRPLALPAMPPGVARRAVYFPGSTVGNFDPRQALRLLRSVAELVGPGGAFLVGIDLVKDPATLTAAYNDAAGVTAAFNLNLLARVNRELGADFDPAQFRHRAFYDAGLGRVEMHLVSQRAQVVLLAGESFAFAEGETIHTESSHKYTPAGFGELAGKAGLAHARTWTDARGWFAVQLYTR